VVDVADLEPLRRDADQRRQGLDEVADGRPLVKLNAKALSELGVVCPDQHHLDEAARAGGFSKCRRETGVSIE
jgi:hypothetical protein